MLHSIKNVPSEFDDEEKGDALHGEFDGFITQTSLFLNALFFFSVCTFQLYTVELCCEVRHSALSYSFVDYADL